MFCSLRCPSGIGVLNGLHERARQGEESPSRVTGVRPYRDIMAHRRRSVIRVLLTALALARPGGLTSV